MLSGLKSSRLPQALLLAGPPGAGKGALARRLAQGLLCSGPNQQGEACGHCPSCTKFSAETHPDFHWVAPAGASISVEQIRGLREQLWSRPTEGQVRVAVIEQAEMMTPSAANALLKTLEEPPAYAYLFLLSPRVGRLLPTVVSRCQVRNLPPPPLAAEAARLAAHPELAALRGLLGSLVRLDDETALATAEAWEKEKETLPERLELLEIWLRDALVWGQVAEPQLLYFQGEVAFVSQLAEQLRPPQLLQMIELVRETQRRLERHANLRLTLDLLWLGLRDLATDAKRG